MTAGGGGRSGGHADAQAHDRSGIERDRDEDGDRDLAAYYARRAATYERIFAKPERQADLRTLEAMLPALFVGRRVLEVACGTGWWAPHAARHAADWLATDVNPEPIAIALAKRKSMPACVRFQILDAFELEAFPALSGALFDAAFAGFWWSHLSLQRLPEWLAQLHRSLAPGARVVMLDNAFVPGSSTAISRSDTAGNTWQLRLLDDGSRHEVLKNFPTEAQALGTAAAAAVLAGRRVERAQWHAVGHYWLFDYTVA